MCSKKSFFFLSRLTSLLLFLEASLEKLYPKFYFLFPACFSRAFLAFVTVVLLKIVFDHSKQMASLSERIGVDVLALILDRYLDMKSRLRFERTSKEHQQPGKLRKSSREKRHY